MAVGDAYVNPGFLTPVLTQLFFRKPQTTFLTCFCRGERRKYAEKKSRLNRGSNSQPPGHESDTLTTEPPGRGTLNLDSSKILSFGKELTKETKIKICQKKRQARIYIQLKLQNLFFKQEKDRGGKEKIICSFSNSIFRTFLPLSQ